MLRLPSGFCYILAGGFFLMGSACKANLLGAWPVDGVMVVPVSPECSCLPQESEQPAMASPMIGESPLPTALFQGRT